MKPVYRLKKNGRSSLYMTIDAEIIYQTKWNDQTLFSQVFDPKTKTVMITPLVCVDGKVRNDESKPSVSKGKPLQNGHKWTIIRGQKLLPTWARIASG